MNTIIKRGQIWYADLGNTYDGSVQGGKRPIVIVSNNKGNYYSPILLVVPITSSNTKHSLPTHVDIQLKAPSIALCEQILTINKKSLISFEGVIGEDKMKKIDECLKISLGLG